MCDSKPNEQVSPHNISFCITTTPSTSPPNSRRCCLIRSFWNSMIISCYCPPCLAPALHPHSLLPVNLFFPFPVLPLQHSARFSLLLGRRGMGMNVEGKRAWKAEKRGALVLGVTEKGKWLCVRVSVGTQSPDRFSVGAIDPVSGEGELISSVFWRCTHALHENSSSLIYLIHISLLASS